MTYRSAQRLKTRRDADLPCRGRSSIRPGLPCNVLTWGGINCGPSCRSLSMALKIALRSSLDLISSASSCAASESRTTTKLDWAGDMSAAMYVLSRTSLGHLRAHPADSRGRSGARVDAVVLDERAFADEDLELRADRSAHPR